MRVRRWKRLKENGVSNASRSRYSIRICIAFRVACGSDYHLSAVGCFVESGKYVCIDLLSRFVMADSELISWEREATASCAMQCDQKDNVSESKQASVS